MNAKKPARAELQPAYEPSLVRRTITPIAASALLLAATTAALWFIETRLPQEHLIFIYFAPTALIAIRFGSRSAMAMAIGAAFAAAFLLYPPRFSFMVDSFLDAEELRRAMLAAGFRGAHFRYIGPGGVALHVGVR